MRSAWTASPWVEQHRDEVSFALQVFPIDTPVDPAVHLLAAGRLAEDLGSTSSVRGVAPGFVDLALEWPARVLSSRCV